MKSQMQNQEPHAEHHFADFFESLAIWGSIGWPLKCKLMGFFGHMLLSRAPPPCVVLCQGPEVNFPGHPRVTKLFCIGSPLNRSRSLTYCTCPINQSKTHSTDPKTNQPKNQLTNSTPKPPIQEALNSSNNQPTQEQPTNARINQPI